jgi:transposase
MPRLATPIKLSDEEEQTLRRWVTAHKTERRMVERARIVLLAAAGTATSAIAQQLNTTPSRVSKWRLRFAEQRLAGLVDRPRAGKPARYDEATRKRILTMLDQSPPEGHATWTGTLLAEALGDVSNHQVWRVLKRQGISLRRRRSWCLSTDPEFARKAADVVGLYLDPPENAVVLAVDEKPSIQALERAQGWLRLPNGKALTGFSHGYKRHGTTTLFAALEVATGWITANHYKRRRRREFLDFMNQLTDLYDGFEIHVILDNLNTHKPRHDRWLQRHKNVHFHYTPTYSSWLNQVEVWFSILSRRALQGASFTSPRQVRAAIDRFIQAYNQNATPFRWTKTTVTPRSLSPNYQYLRK